MREFDQERAVMKDKAIFEAFDVKNYMTANEIESKVKKSTLILVAELNGNHLGFIKEQLSYHHVAQGIFNGEPYAIAFCSICNTGVRMIPVIGNRRLHFEARGIYDGLVLLGDRETGSYWNHITGECVLGELKGKKIQTYPLLHTTFEKSKNLKGIHFAVSKDRILMKLLNLILGLFPNGFIPPHFHKTMKDLDYRLPPMTKGVGVWIGDKAKFYPIESINEKITDEFQGKTIIIEKNVFGDSYHAEIMDSDQPLNQIFGRWYGISSTFRDMEIYEGSL